MLISSRKKFIFFHLPKSAGSSVNAVLRGYADIPFDRVYHYLFDIFGQSPRLGVYERHIKPRELRPLMQEQKFDEYFKFSFVRNPWDWHVSQYFYHMQNPKALFHHTFKEMDFDAFIHWSIAHPEESNNRQKAFLCDESGRLMVDFVGKYENLEDDFAHIARQLGLKARLQRRNPSAHLGYRQYYDDSLREEIARAFKEDIDYFGYEF